MSLNLEPVPRVPLARAPLVHVLCQVRFSQTPELVAGAAEGRLRELLPEYPDMKQERGLSLPLPPLIDSAPQEVTQYVLRDLTGDWSVTVARDFVAVATTQYRDRDDFAGRVRSVLGAVATIAAPAVVERIGVRYIDRLTDQAHITELSSLVTRELLACIPEATGGVAVTQQIVHTLIRKDDEEVLIRSLLLPPNALYDPLVAAEPVTSWVLDIDAYWVDRVPFNVDDICTRQVSLGERVHSAFRWSVTPRFLTSFSTPEGDT